MIIGISGKKNSGKISLVCNNKRQKAYGFKWKFKK